MAFQAFLARYTTAAPDNVPAPTGHTPADPGYCYLAAFKDRSHARVEAEVGRYTGGKTLRAALEYFSSEHYEGHLRVTFGTQASVRDSQKWQVHIERVSASESLLRPKDLITMIPDYVRAGDEIDPTRAAPVIQNRMQPNLSALGRPAPATRRRFMYSDWSFTATKSLEAAYVKSVDPLAGTHIASYLAFTQYARYESLTVHLIPGPGARYYASRINLAWHPDSESAPDGLAAFRKSPTHEVHVMASSFLGGQPNIIRSECPMLEYGLQDVCLPKPHYGGVPKLAIRFQGALQYKPDGSGKWDEAALPVGTEILEVHIEAVINLDPN